MRSALLDGLVLATLSLEGASGGAGLAQLSSELASGVRARLEELGRDPRRDEALATLAASARPSLVEALPPHARAAAVLAPVATSSARAHAGALPTPRRGYRVPPGLQELLRRVATGGSASARAAAERLRVEGRPWPA